MSNLSISKRDLKLLKTVSSIPTEYHYSRRALIMTKAEIRFFKLLDSILADKYYLFPQIHLPALFEHRLKGQTWWAAYQHINRKSVDYVICSIDELKPIVAIELDDWSHELSHRKVRDLEVERIFDSTGLPLLRFEGRPEFPKEYILTALRSVDILDI